MKLNRVRIQILVLILALNAQAALGQFSLGVRGGININEFALKNLPSGLSDYTNTNVGFHLGLFGQFGISKNLLFITELQYVQKGTNSSDINNNAVRINLNYLEVPFLLSVTTIKKINFDIGPSIGYKISAFIKTDGSRNNISGQYEKNLDFGVMAGLRFTLTEKLSIIGRYYYGIATIDELYYADSNNNQTRISYHNRNVYFGLGYKIK